MDEKNLRRFFAPLYENKDIMHNLSHIDRIAALAKKMHAKHTDADMQTIIFGAYFHGLIYNQYRRCREKHIGRVFDTMAKPMPEKGTPKYRPCAHCRFQSSRPLHKACLHN